MDELASTKDVLGEHLHQKIKEQVHSEFDNEDDKAGLVGKITGILLERPVKDIFTMLTDKSFLQNNIDIASDSLRSERMLSGTDEVKLNCSGHILNDVNSSPVLLSEDDISERLYQKVCQLDPDHAPQITGILLEMGNLAVRDMLEDTQFFARAFEKAKICLQPRKTDSLHAEKDLSLVIYERAVSKYGNYAPQITGMILELDPATLQRIVRDGCSLDRAIVKAYSVLAPDHQPS